MYNQFFILINIYYKKIIRQTVYKCKDINSFINYLKKGQYT